MRLLALCLSCAALASADPVTLRLKLPKGQTMKVEQTLALTSTANPSTRSKSGGVASVYVQTPFILAEKWSDACVEDKDGEPVQVRRTILGSKIATGKIPTSATTQEGCVFLITKGDKGSTVKAEKGKPDDLSVSLLAKGPPDLMQVMLPPDPVEVGASWKVDNSLNSPLQYMVSAGKAGAQGNARNALRSDIDRMDDKKSPIGVGSATSGGCEVTATLKAVKDNIATIEFSGEQEIDPANVAGAGPDSMLPKSKTVVTGTLTFDVAAGRPVKLTWTSRHVVEDTQSRDVKFPGFTEEWGLARTYSK